MNRLCSLFDSVTRSIPGVANSLIQLSGAPYNLNLEKELAYELITTITTAAAGCLVCSAALSTMIAVGGRIPPLNYATRQIIYSTVRIAFGTSLRSEVAIALRILSAIKKIPITKSFARIPITRLAVELPAFLASIVASSSLGSSRFEACCIATLAAEAARRSRAIMIV